MVVKSCHRISWLEWSACCWLVPLSWAVPSLDRCIEGTVSVTFNSTGSRHHYSMSVIPYEPQSCWVVFFQNVLRFKWIYYVFQAYGIFSCTQPWMFYMALSKVCICLRRVRFPNLQRYVLNWWLRAARQIELNVASALFVSYSGHGKTMGQDLVPSQVGFLALFSQQLSGLCVPLSELWLVNCLMLQCLCELLDYSATDAGPLTLR